MPAGKYDRPPFKDRFWAQVDILDPDECWEWIGTRDRHGYGKMGTNKKTKLSHRISYEMEIGEIPDGYCILHTCDNPPCCNPAHLWAGTHADNMRDMASKGRANNGRHARGGTYNHGSRNGMAKLTEDQVLEARRLHLLCDVTITELSRTYNVSQAAMSCLINGKSWKHVPFPKGLRE